nr:hypothetical protein [Tanacetum cinerariifolium]
QVYHSQFVHQGQYRVLGHEPLSALIALSQRAAGVLDGVFRQYVKSPREYALGTALVLGFRDDIDAATKQAYANTGTTHIMAVSGLQHLQHAERGGFPAVALQSIFALRRWVSAVFPGRAQHRVSAAALGALVRCPQSRARPAAQLARTGPAAPHALGRVASRCYLAAHGAVCGGAGGYLSAGAILLSPVPVQLFAVQSHCSAHFEHGGVCGCGTARGEGAGGAASAVAAVARLAAPAGRLRVSGVHLGIQRVHFPRWPAVSGCGGGRRAPQPNPNAADFFAYRGGMRLFCHAAAGLGRHRAGAAGLLRGQPGG